MNNNLLFFDLETCPNVVNSWAVGRDINLTTENIVEERRIICISYKWHQDDYVHRLTWDKNQCDRDMLKEFSQVVRESAAVVGHNSDRFDIKWIKTRALIHGLEPLNHIKSIDTLKLARKNFNFNSNRLDYLGDILGLGRKKETGGYSLWTRVMAGDKEALEEMGEYCDRDVVLLEDVYNKIAPHAEGAQVVHKGVLRGGSRLDCDVCGARTYAGHTYKNKTGAKQKVIRCSNQDCRKSTSVPLKIYNRLSK